MFIVQVSVVAKLWQPKCPSKQEQFFKFTAQALMEWSIAIKKNVLT